MRRLWPVLLALCGCLDKASDDSIQAADAAVLFNENELNDFHLTMSPADWDSIINDPMNEVWRPATLQWKDATLGMIGVRASGETSRTPGNPKVPLSLRFNAFVSGQKFFGLKRLKLDGLSPDPLMMKDRLAYGIARARLPAPRAVHARLFVNGEHRGVYGVEERVDSVFVKRHYGPVLGNLYRIRYMPGDPFAWAGPDPASYVPVPWEPRTNEQTADHGVVVRYIDTLNNNPASFPAVCDMEQLLEYFAVEQAIADVDGFFGSDGAEDFFQYYRTDTGAMHIMPWDFDDAFWGGEQDRSIWQNFPNTRLSQLVASDPVLRQQYKSKVGEIMATGMLPANLQARIDFIYGQIREAVYADPYKPYTNQVFDDVYKFTRNTWVPARYTNVQAELVAP